MLKQVKIQLKNLTKFEVKDEKDCVLKKCSKIVDFEGPNYVGGQQMTDVFTYEREKEGTLNIYNVHYKDHTYDPETSTANLTLEEICCNEGVLESVYNVYYTYNDGIQEEIQFKVDKDNYIKYHDGSSDNQNCKISIDLM